MTVNSLHKIIETDTGTETETQKYTEPFITYDNELNESFGEEFISGFPNSSAYCPKCLVGIYLIDFKR